MGKRYTKNKHQSHKENLSNLHVEELSSISIENYHVYHVVSNGEIVGYLGVFLNGVFRLSVTSNSDDKTDVSLFVKNYIRKELHLIPTPDSRLS